MYRNPNDIYFYRYHQTNVAVAEGHINVLQWLVSERRCVRPDEDYINLSTRCGRTDILEWLERRNHL